MAHCFPLLTGNLSALVVSSGCGSLWYSIAPVANNEASVLSSNCWWGSGGTRTGLLIMACLNALTASVASGVHSKMGPFLVRSVRGLAILAKSRMNGLWYPTVPRNLHTSLTDLRVSLYSLI